MMWKNAIRKLWDNNRIKNICYTVAFAAASGSVLLSGLTVKADDDYLDSVYVNDSINSSFELTSSQVMVTSDCYYDNYTGKYYTAITKLGETSIESNVCDGMYIQGEVRLKVGNGGYQYELYKNGKLIEDFSGDSITEPGAYTVAIYNNSGKKETPLSFTIIGAYTNNTIYTFPENMHVVSVTKDGASADYTNSRVELTTEGQYKITYRVDGVEDNYNLDVTIDMEPPVLALEAVDEKGRAHGPVDISDLEEDCEIYITVDGESIRYSDELTSPGTYKVLLVDKAGNQTLYNFTILIYFNTNSLLFFAMILLCIAGVIAYMVYVNKHLRVR